MAAPTIIAFTTHTTLGEAEAMQASVSNISQVFSSSVKQGTDAYSWDLNVAAGNLGDYLRLTSRSTLSGITATLNTASTYLQFYIYIGTLPDKSVDIVVFSSNNTTANVNTGRMGVLRLATTGEISMHDSTALNSATATKAGTAQLAEGTWYRGRVNINTDGTYALTMYLASNGRIVEKYSGSGASFGASVCAAIFFGWTMSPWCGTNTDPTFRLYYGSALVASGGYPHTAARIGIKLASGVGTYDNWTLDAGASKTAAVNTLPPDGNTTRIKCSTAFTFQTFTLASCAASGITGVPLAFSPFYIGWNESSLGNEVCRMRESSQDFDTTASNPGSTQDFHLRGILYTAMPSDSSAPTLAKLDLIEAGVGTDSGTDLCYAGTIGCHVVYVPSTFTIYPTKDAFVSAAATTNNNGASQNTIFGSTSGNSARHGLETFSELDVLPTNATISTASFSMNVTTPSAVGSPFEFDRVTQAWLEGTGSATASADGATWLTYDGSGTWAAQGGDFTTSQQSLGSAMPTSTGANVFDLAVLAQDAVTNRSGLLDFAIKRTTENAGTQGVCTFDSKDTVGGTPPSLTVTFTVPLVPTVTTTDPATNLAATTATCSGNVTSDGGATVSERGIAYGTSSSPTVSGSHSTTAGTTGAFSVNLSGLTAGTTYHFRAYATNSQGTSYGADVTFNTTGSGGRGVGRQRGRGMVIAD